MNRLALFAFAAPLLAQQLTLVSGNGQLVNEQFKTTAPMVVRAVDAQGRPAAGVPVTWTITQGQGSINEPQHQTDSNGLARAFFLATSLQPSTTMLPSVVTASSGSSSVGFYVTTVESTGIGAGQPTVQVAGESLQRGSSGATLATPIEVVVAASTGAFRGQGIPNVSVRVVPSPNATESSPTASCNGPGGVVLTNARGIAQCYLVLGSNTGTTSFTLMVGEITNTREFGLEVTRGQTCRITVTPSTLNIGAAGGSAAINVSAVNCAWNAQTGASWITLRGTTSGTGNGQLTADFAPNTGATRNALITIGSASVNVTQSAAGTTVPLAFAVGATLPQGATGIPYSFTLAVNGGQTPYTWTATGPLPPGLSLNSSTGVVSGTPTAAGSQSFTVGVRDAAGSTISQTFTLTIGTGQNPGGGLAITTASLPRALINTSYSAELRATGGCPNPFSGGVRLEIVSGGLPPGLNTRSLVGGSGVEITGTPTQAGTFSFIIRASDTCGAAVTKSFSIQVSASPSVPPMVSTAEALSFTLRPGITPAEQTFTISAGASILDFTAAASSDAGWLGISPERGTTQATITARVINTNLEPGTYQGAITITSQAANSPLRIPATLTVSSASTVVSTPSRLTFDFEPGGLMPNPQTLSIGSPAGAVPISVTATTSAGGSWLTTVQTQAQTPVFVTVTVNPTNLPPGTYAGTVIVTPAFNGPAATVPVTLNVGRTAPAVTSVVNGASFQAGAIAPGEIVTLFGTGLGPQELAMYQLTSAGTISTEVSGVRVLFDDTPAPLIHVSASQTSVVVPYGIGGRVSTRVQVEYQGVRSQPFDVPVAQAAPALFTLGGGPQGAILNQDNSVNGPQNGARAGTIVSLFATGEGVTAPPSVEGTIVSVNALTKPVLPVRVTIAGREAEVLYAGSAPTMPAGMLQVNVRIPEGTAAGTSVPVVLTVGNATSQAGVTLVVRQ